MGYITSNIDSRLIKFEIRIQCYECTSYNCEHTIVETSPNPRESDLVIRYRCVDCGNMVDKESS